MRGHIEIVPALDLLAKMPDESVDLVVTDPPYSSLEVHRAKGTTTRLKNSDGSSNEWFPTITNDSLPTYLEHFYRILKPNSHLYLFCDEFTADVIKEQQGITSKRTDRGCRECVSGFLYWREIIWAKTSKTKSSHRAGVGYHYRGASERILFFEKGRRKLNDLGQCDVQLTLEDDVLGVPRSDAKGTTPKPVSLLRTLIEQSTDPGQLVFDCFAGTGSLGIAAVESGRDFLLGDITAQFLDPRLREYFA